MKNTSLDRMYITNIMKDYECDTFFPAIPTEDWEMVEEKMVPKEVQEEEGVKFEYKVFNIQKVTYRVNRIIDRFVVDSLSWG